MGQMEKVPVKEMSLLAGSFLPLHNPKNIS